MKSFTSILALAASVASVHSQYTLNSSTGAITCGIANAVYCAGDSMTASIIIRCNGFVGYAGNCNDNLAGEPPSGDDGEASCWAQSPSSGIAACEKNCVVYGSSGNSDTFTLDGCTPYFTPNATTTASSGAAPTHAVSVSSNATSFSTFAVSLQTIGASSGILRPTGVTTGLIPFPTNGTSAVHSSGSGAATSTAGSSSGGSGSSAGAGSATATPKSPTASIPPPVSTFTGAANTAKAGSALAFVCLFAATFL